MTEKEEREKLEIFAAIAMHALLPIRCINTPASLIANEAVGYAQELIRVLKETQAQP